ncbi:MAG: DUF2059 domain-containing protein [Hyphomicrobiales bacterium]
MTELFLKGMLAISIAGGLLTPTFAGEPDAKMEALAERVLVASGNDARITAIHGAFALRERLTKALQAALANASDTVKSRIAKAVDAEIQFEVDEIFKENVKIYASRFTETQLNDMIAFYNSPGGKALVAQTPAIVQEKATFGGQLGREAVQRMVVSVCGKQASCD